MFDSSAKLPAGLLNGNVNQYGDFDQCLSISSQENSDMEIVQGKYCLSELDIRLATDHPLFEIDQLLHSLYFFDSEFKDVSILAPSKVFSFRSQSSSDKMLYYVTGFKGLLNIGFLNLASKWHK